MVATGPTPAHARRALAPILHGDAPSVDQGWAAARRALPPVRGGIHRLVELGS